jgi:photosystem II stability/assembly factor-like uncharacterized protein
MKKLILFLAVIFSINISYTQQNHHLENMKPLPDGVTMNSFQFIDSGTGWVSCSKGYILKTSDEGLSWKLINTRTDSYLRSISFINHEIGWIAGNDNTLLKTEDGGKTWSTVTTGLPANTALGYVKFFNDKLGYLVGGYDSGNNKMIFNSSDNGKTWSTVTKGDVSMFDSVFYNERNDLSAIVLDYKTYKLLEFKSKDNGTSWTVEDDGREKWLNEIVNENGSEINGEAANFRTITPVILKTTDGGNTWIQKTSISAGPAFFTDWTNGFIIANGDVYKTENSGEVWDLVFDSAGLWSLFFTDNNHGWVGGIRYAQQGRTTDAGRTWTEFNNGNDINAFFYLNPDEGWMASSHHNAPFNSVYEKSTNGGASYNNYFAPYYMTIKNLFYTSINSGWAIAENEKLMKTNSSGDFRIFPFFGNKTTVQSMHFFNSQVGWCLDTETDNWWIQGYSNIWKTTNSGKQWFLVKEKLVVSGSKIYFADENYGWNNAANYGLERTTDGGNSWQFVAAGWHFNSFNFMNNETGWGVGYNQQGDNSVLQSVNGGLNWIAKSSDNLPELTDVKFFDNQRGIVIGNNGTIITTSDGGESWNIQVSGTANNLKAIFLLGQNIAYVVGDNGIILISSDGGNNWFAQTGGTTSNLNFITFTGKYTGWIAGNSGTVLFTSNGGSTWTAVESGTTSNLTTINFANTGYGWIGGEKGTLLRIKPSHSISINSDRIEDVDGSDISSNAYMSKSGESTELIPDEYVLYQNYPNPFNPVTTIEFTIPEDVKAASLVIYNILGERIAELANSSFEPGRYKYQWDASGFTSGLYIYELKTDKFTSIKKMLLVK